MITRQEALDFLKSNQPLPPDKELTEATISSFNDIRLFFAENPSPEAVPLLLNSFGKGSGFGVYQLVEDTLLKQDREVVLFHLSRSLLSRVGSVAYWSAQIASHFPSDDLVSPLSKLLADGSFDERFAAITALEQISSENSESIIRNHRIVESDPEILELIDSVLEGKNAP